MRILVVTHYFWPEVFRINEIVKFFREKNYNVDILTGPPNYPEGKLHEDYRLNKKKFNNYYGSKIYRVPVFLRRDGRPFFIFLNYFTFIISGIFFGLFLLRNKKYDIVFSFATSPLTSSLVALFFSKIKLCKSFIWVLDIWPDILKELNVIKNNFLYKFIKWISAFIYKKFDFILSQSQTFRKILITYTNNKNNNYYFPAWPEDLKKNLNKKDNTNNKTNNIFKIVFTGNIGAAQNFNQVIKVAEILKDYKDIQWIIVGSGRELEKIREKILKKKINNFIIEGKKPINKINYYHNISTILFLSLKNGRGLSATIPGKLQTYLAANKFILGMVEGEAKRIIEQSKTGICINPSKPNEVAKLILHLKGHPEIIKKVNDSSSGIYYLNKNFNKNILLSFLNNKLNEVYKSYKKIKLLKNISQIPFKENFSLSGLNLAFLGYLETGKIKLHEKLLHWPDGILKKIFYENKIKKIPGYTLISSIRIPYFINEIFVYGLLSKNSKNYLCKKFPHKKILHIDLPYDKIENLYKFCPRDLKKNQIIFLTLPTPKQEQFAARIVKLNKYFKIICIGGGISIASGDEVRVPKFMNKLNLEFIWRLRTDSTRRFTRLIYTFFLYLRGTLNFKFARIKFLTFK